MRNPFVAILLLLLLLSSCMEQKAPALFPADVTWVDLTHSYDSTTLYWPNNAKGFVHSTDAAGITALGYYYSSYSIGTPEHGGTHLDAPIHFAENKLTVDKLPITSLTGSAVVIDITEKALKDRDYLLSIADIESWENAHGIIPDNSIILLRTGYGKYYPDRANYFGTAKQGLEAIPELHFPGIAPETAEWLIKNRNIKAMGLDTPSLDRGQSRDFQTHRVLLGQDKPGFENLANLDQLPPTGAYIIALPMKIGGGSGGPLRIVAALQ